MSAPDTPGPEADPNDAGFLDVDAELGDMPPSSDIPAAPDSPLRSLRERRAAVLLEVDLEVPRLEPPVFVRYKAVSQRRVEEIGEQVDRRSVKDKTVMFNATVLADACVGVFEVIDGEKVSVDPDDRGGPWPKFDKRLAGLLGVRAGKASEVVRALYATDGDILVAADSLVAFSRHKSTELDELGEDASGN